MYKHQFFDQSIWPKASKSTIVMETFFSEKLPYKSFETKLVMKE